MPPFNAASHPPLAPVLAPLVGPLAWSLQLVFAYALVEGACRLGAPGATGLTVGLVGLTVAAALPTAATLWKSYGEWQRERASEGQAERREEERQRFLLFLSLVVNVLFLVLILLTLVPAALLRPCA